MSRPNKNSTASQSIEAPTQTVMGSISRWALPAILAIYLVFGVLHAFSTPLVVGYDSYQDAPDEAAHITYIKTLAAGHMPTQRSPHAGVANGSADYEWHQPPLYYAIAVPFLLLGEHGVRILTLLLGLGTLLFIYGAARLIRPDDELIALTAVGIAAFVPGHIAILSSANNDALLELCFCAAIYLLTLSLKTPSSTKIAVLLGISVGAALITKTTAVLLIPVLICAALLSIRACAYKQVVAKNLLVSLATAFALSGWWFIRNAVLYRELLPLKLFQQAFGGTAQAIDVVNGKVVPNVHGWADYWTLVSQWCFKSFLAVYSTPLGARFGGPAFLPDSVYLLMLLVTVASIAGMAKLHFRQKDLFTTQTRFALYIGVLTLALVAAAYLLFVSKYFQTQGRYLYPAMLPICLTIAMGWLELFPAKYKRMASAGLLTVLCLICIVFLLQTSNRGQKLPPDTAAETAIQSRSGTNTSRRSSEFSFEAVYNTVHNSPS